MQPQSTPQPGSFVEVRGRQWVVEAPGLDEGKLQTLKLSCISDDAQGEQLEVIWGAEINPRLLDGDAWSSIARDGTDDAAVFSAFLRTVRWNTATAADRDLFQAPFRAGIRLDVYQLLPLRKALRLPRVNLLIADDVGLGKTIEAGLIVRELLLRRRIDLVVVAAPPSMTLQWQDELESKFGLSFQIIDRDRLSEMRRTRGFSVNPWTTGSRFIISHRLLTEETYVSGLRDVLGEFRSRALLILDEAHHAAPASGTKYAVASQFTKAVEDIAKRFEHRLFLSATPHNGHSNSFSALLEMLDPQRFTRGVEVRPNDLDAIMVRRLKSDLRRIGEAFPERVIEPIALKNLPNDAPELQLSRMLAEYRKLRERRLARLSRAEAGLGRMVFVGLQQRLLSSVAAFSRTLKVHHKTLQSHIERAANGTASVGAAEAFAMGTSEIEQLEFETEEEALTAIAADEDAVAAAASDLGAKNTTVSELKVELSAVEAMLEVANRHGHGADARVRWLLDWMTREMVAKGTWNERRLIIFTEYEDTRRWLERQLKSAFSESDRIDERIDTYTGATGIERRERVKRAFNAEPQTEPIRVLICTDAAREGINLQTRCFDLIHFDLPWNPSRLEQRNGRIDRKLQPEPKVYCRYFRYEQREEDIVLDALVRKTETIRTQLGSAGQVIEERIAKRLSEAGIGRGQEARELAEALIAEDDRERLAKARFEMSDGESVRNERLLRDIDDLRKSLERARERVGVDPEDLHQVVAAALSRMEYGLDAAKGEKAGEVDTFRFDPRDKAFCKDRSWSDVFDDLRVRKRRRGERIAEWRNSAEVRSIAFTPPTLADGRDAPGVVQVHLEHRLVRRLLSRFISQGFQSGLNRVCVIEGPGAQPRVVLLGRIALYGAKAARLHEEIIAVTAIWPEADRGSKPLRVLGEGGEATTLAQLEVALRKAKSPRENAIPRALMHTARDIEEMMPELARRSQEQLKQTGQQLVERGEAEAKSLTRLLEEQQSRIAKAVKGFDPNQLSLPGIAAEERKQMEADRRHWSVRLERLERELYEEPQRVRQSYVVRAHRLEPVGLVYLWPASG